MHLAPKGIDISPGSAIAGGIVIEVIEQGGGTALAQFGVTGGEQGGRLFSGEQAGQSEEILVVGADLGCDRAASLEEVRELGLRIERGEFRNSRLWCEPFDDEVPEALLCRGYPHDVIADLLHLGSQSEERCDRRQEDGGTLARVSSTNDATDCLRKEQGGPVGGGPKTHIQPDDVDALRDLPDRDQPALGALVEGLDLFA